jgi:hypothetical protein
LDTCRSRRRGPERVAHSRSSRPSGATVLVREAAWRRAGRRTALDRQPGQRGGPRLRARRLLGTIDNLHATCRRARALDQPGGALHGGGSVMSLKVATAAATASALRARRLTFSRSTRPSQASHSRDCAAPTSAAWTWTWTWTRAAFRDRADAARGRQRGPRARQGRPRLRQRLVRRQDLDRGRARRGAGRGTEEPPHR